MLSKSRLLAYRQCPRRLWLQVHRPALEQIADAARARFAVGHQVGELARRHYDPEGRGTLLDPQAEGYDAALARSAALLGRADAPLFEGGFRADGVLVFADVMLPVGGPARRAWRIVEVKSTTSVKDTHRDDVAIQGFVARRAGLPIASLAVAHLDGRWTYPGGGDYSGLLTEVDLTDEALRRDAEVADWIAGAQRVAADPAMPETRTGAQCSDPYPCGFLAHCQGQAPQPVHPITVLPGSLRPALAAKVRANGWTDVRELPDDDLSDLQRRVKTATLSGRPFFAQAEARRALGDPARPAWFMDFETVSFAVPIWAGTRPYQPIPCQFSVHRLGRTGELDERVFLDLSGDDPARRFAQALIAACGTTGPVHVYHAAFERTILQALAARFPLLADALQAIVARIVDLLPVARQHYYHPDQQGSWSVKAVLPALCPDLRYDDLDGVRDGEAAMDAYREAIDPRTDASRKATIERQLLAYCALDTYAMVRIWSAFSGQSVPDGPARGAAVIRFE